MLRLRSTVTLASLLSLVVYAGCASDNSDLFNSNPENRGGVGGGTANGGSDTGGKASGGKSSGGRASTGGSAEGGDDTGGTASGGMANGGSASGGKASGGDSSGGTATGGKAAATGGSASGGKSMGGASAGGSGGAPTGGIIGVGGKAVCSDTDGSDVRVQGTSKGLNGTFTDKCDKGSLVEYFCEKEIISDPSCFAAAAASGADLAAPRPIPIPGCEVFTGEVTSSLIDCGGLCKDGTCMYWCPTVEDEVRYVEAQSDAVLLENTTSNFRYACEVTFQRDGYDCATESLEGSVVGVYSLGECTLDEVIFGTDTPQEPGIQTCTYRCSLVD